MSGVKKPRSPKGTPLDKRFWDKVDKSGGDDSCWPWTYCVDGRGYGMFSLPRGTTKMIRANRMALQLHLGRVLLPDEESCHSCDNPSCCNPRHLFIGSHDDNLKDYAEKHFAKGSRHSQAKLTHKDYLIAMRMRKEGHTQRAIADHFGIDKSYVSRLVRGLTGHTVLENLNEQ